MKAFLSCFLISSALLVWRLYYGLSQNFWHEDVEQIYLLGLKYFATGQWPYFGPDVVHTGKQIPGALQALLVGLPIKIWEAAEAPFVLVNILSMLGLLVLAFYFSRKFTRVGFYTWILWLSTLPMTLQFSTNTYNPSYLLGPAVMFFIGFMESIDLKPVFKMSQIVSFMMMGLALGWVMQLHLSWPLMIPFFFYAFGKNRHQGQCWRSMLGVLIGLGVGGIFLWPTVLQYGVSSIWEAGLGTTTLNGLNIQAAPEAVFRFWVLGSYEFLGFNLGASVQERKDVILSNPVLSACALILTLGLVAQILILLRSIFFSFRNKNWSFPLTLLLGTSVIVAGLFLFTSRPPVNRNFYVLIPFVLFAFADLMNQLWDKVRIRRAMAMLILSSAVFHSLVGMKIWREISIYKNISRIESAIEQKDDHLFGERRPGIY